MDSLIDRANQISMMHFGKYIYFSTRHAYSTLYKDKIDNGELPAPADCVESMAFIQHLDEVKRAESVFKNQDIKDIAKLRRLLWQDVRDNKS